MKKTLIQYKKIVSLKTLFLLMVIYPFSAISEVRYSKTNGTYRIFGHVEDPVFTKTSGNLITGLELYISKRGYIYKKGADFCPDEKKATEVLNKMLSGNGTMAYEGHNYNHDRTYRFLFGCNMSENSPWVLWYIEHGDLIKPTDCKLDIPTNVEFGEISMGTKGIEHRLEGSLRCDYKISVDLSLSGKAINGTGDNQKIKIGDAIVGYSFDNNKTTISVSTEKDVTSKFNLDFVLKDTGKSAGNKQENVVLKADWL